MSLYQVSVALGAIARRREYGNEQGWVVMGDEPMDREGKSLSGMHGGSAGFGGDGTNENREKDVRIGEGLGRECSGRGWCRTFI